ncbi:MAG: hypothetical protein ACLFWG_07930, partial [Longimicrobiales bacterium]
GEGPGSPGRIRGGLIGRRGLSGPGGSMHTHVMVLGWLRIPMGILDLLLAVTALPNLLAGAGLPARHSRAPTGGEARRWLGSR